MHTGSKGTFHDNTNKPCCIAAPSLCVAAQVVQAFTETQFVVQYAYTQTQTQQLVIPPVI
jgi:hypothetical protein